MVEDTPSPKQGEATALRLREMEHRLQETEAELLKRDRMVQELTRRLSQTAERLDRFQRTGSDRNVISTAAFPKEVVEQQTELVADLQRAVQMWEDMQVSCGLGRLEMQVSDLQTLFEERFREDEPEPEPEENPAETAEAATVDTEEEASAPSDNEAGGSAVESKRESASESAAENNPDPNEEWELTEEAAAPPSPPEILNLPEADVQSLRRCVEQQDEYIDYLSARLQRTAERKTAVNWDALAENPEKLARMLDHTVTRLRQGRQFTEFELTLQRTRLKRRERDLQMLSETLEVQMQSVSQKFSFQLRRKLRKRTPLDAYAGHGQDRRLTRFQVLGF